MTERSAGSPAGTKRVLPPLPSTLTFRHRSRSTQGPGPRAPPRAARTRRPARTARGRAARAAWWPGCGSAAPRRPPALSVRGSRCGCLGAGSRSAGFAVISPSSTIDLKNERIAASLRATVRGPAPRAGELGGVAAQHGVVDGVGLDAVGAAPERELAEVDAVGAARALGGAAALQLAVERRAWRPRQASLAWGVVASFFIDTDTGQVATLRQLDEAGVVPHERQAAAARGSRSRARATRPPCGTR